MCYRKLCQVTLHHVQWEPENPGDTYLHDIFFVRIVIACLWRFFFERDSMNIDLDNMTTEARNKASVNLDVMSPLEIIKLMNDNVFGEEILGNGDIDTGETLIL